MAVLAGFIRSCSTRCHGGHRHDREGRRSRCFCVLCPLFFAVSAVEVTPYRVVPAGDSALVVEFEARIDLAVNARAIALAEAVQAAGVAGVRDVVPTYRSVAIHFDPLRTDVNALNDCIERAASRAEQ